MNSSIFAQRFSDLMQQKNMKQVDLIRIAQEQGVKLGKSQISQYVAGKSVPRKDMPVLSHAADRRSTKGYAVVFGRRFADHA